MLAKGSKKYARGFLQVWPTQCIGHVNMPATCRPSVSGETPVLKQVNSKIVTKNIGFSSLSLIWQQPKAQGSVNRKILVKSNDVLLLRSIRNALQFLWEECKQCILGSGHEVSATTGWRIFLILSTKFYIPSSLSVNIW